MALALLLASWLYWRSRLRRRADGDCQPSGSQVVCTFSYTGAAQSWTVPDGVSQATFEVHGAQGGSSGGVKLAGLAGRRARLLPSPPVMRAAKGATPASLRGSHRRRAREGTRELR